MSLREVDLGRIIMQVTNSSRESWAIPYPWLLKVRGYSKGHQRNQECCTCHLNGRDLRHR